MSTPTFNDLMKGFGVVTVMDVCVLKSTRNTETSCCDLNEGALIPDDFEWTGTKIDTLKIANINQEGPTKTITGGKNSNTLIKYGKTTTIEMQDALGSINVLTDFFGCDARYAYKVGNTYVQTGILSEWSPDFHAGISNCHIQLFGKEYCDDMASSTITCKIGSTTIGLNEFEYNGSLWVEMMNMSSYTGDELVTVTYTPSVTTQGDFPTWGNCVSFSVTNKFPSNLALQGKTYFIEQKTGSKVPVYIFIPSISPDAILNLTQDAEGDAAVFDLNGQLQLTRIADENDGSDARNVFYEIRETPFKSCAI